MHTLEEFVDLVSGSSNPIEMTRHFDVFVGAMADLKSRLQANELSQLQNAKRIDDLESHTAGFTARLISVETDRTTLQKRQDDIEKKPAEHNERLDTLEKRVRTIEGAVGAKSGSGTQGETVKPDAKQDVKETVKPPAQPSTHGA